MNNSFLEKTEKRIENKRKAYLESYTKIIESLILATSVTFVFLSVVPNVTNKTFFWVAAGCFLIVLISSLSSLFFIKDLHYGEMSVNTMIMLSLQAPEMINKEEDFKKLQEILERTIKGLQKEVLPKEKKAEFFLRFAFIVFIIGLLMVMFSFI